LKKKPLAAMREDAESRVLTRDFVGRHARQDRQGQAAVIAESQEGQPVKRRAARGFRSGRHCPKLCRRGRVVSAACLSVLTDRQFFQGSMSTTSSRHAQSCQLPVLRKDFMIDAYQIYESRAPWGRCILLIAACLDDAQMNDLEAMAPAAWTWLCWWRCTTAPSSSGRCKLKTPLIGINNRNLRTFEVSIQTTLALRADVPPGRLLVTESGILSRADVRTMRDAKVDAFLVGEAFMRAPDPGLALAELFA
jgi:indole-3-glycerol phosphate synthase